MSFKLFYTFCFLFLFNLAFSQSKISILVFDQNNLALVGATIQGKNKIALTDSAGKAIWVMAMNAETVLIKYLGYKDTTITWSENADIKVVLQKEITELAIAEIIGNWVNKNSSVVHTTLNQEQLNQKMSVQDMPYILQHFPSTVSTSDAGNGIGYTGLRIRGLDPTQINVLINGIPLNDAESQGVFWVDLPDIIASASEVQVQRGIGLSGSGQVAFGSSVLINTNKFSAKSFLNIQGGLGSFNTRKVNIEAGSGLLKGNWNINGRWSHIYSDGYISRAKTNMFSGNLSISKVDAKRSFRFHIFDGFEKTYQAWYGVPVQYINTSKRTFNVAGTEKAGSPYANQIDHYRQTHFQFLYTENLSPKISFQNTFHFTPGNGYYEEYKADQAPENYKLPKSDLLSIVRRRLLANLYFGSVHSLRLDSKSSEYQLGGSWNVYQGRHYGQVIQANNHPVIGNPIYYDQNASKWSVMAFGKAEFHIHHFSILGDIQWRTINYSYYLEYKEDAEKQKVGNLFLNPKLGLSWNLAKGIQLFGFSGIAHREPNRDDYVNADANKPKSEKLWDNEMGFRLSRSVWSLEQNFYYMKYKNQLIPTGKLNDVGAYIRSNVLDSYRMGSETSIRWQPNAKTQLNANLTLSKNRTSELSEFIDNWDTGSQEKIHHKSNPIAFSPEKVFNIFGMYETAFWQSNKTSHLLNVDLAYQSIARQYLDGSGSSSSILHGYQLLHGGFIYSMQKNHKSLIDIKIQCNNLLNKQYESNGWIYRFKSPSYNPVNDDPYAQSEGVGQYSLKGLYPQAGRTFYLTTKIYF
ncbi:MAG: TonB-dependent receptor plug domain-containing protein [Saprospiraceae bacterium]